MSLSNEVLLDLMAYADGELEGDDARRVEALLATDEEARNIVSELQASPIGDWVARSQEEHAVASGADSIAASVMEKIQAEARPASLDEARRKRAVRQRGAWAVAGLVAVAAGVTLYLRSEAPREEPRTIAVAPPQAPAPQGAPTGNAPVEPRTAVATNAGEEPGVEVDTVESPAHEVSVFYVPAVAAAASLNASSVVIWIEDTKDPKGK